MHFAYIASPYTHPKPYIRLRRYRAVMRCIHWSLRNLDTIAFSPILYTHELGTRYSLPPDADFWLRFNETVLTRCDEIYVLMIPGWQESRGVQMEIQWATERNRPILGLLPHGRTYLISSL